LIKKRIDSKPELFHLKFCQSLSLYFEDQIQKERLIQVGSDYVEDQFQ